MSEYTNINGTDGTTEIKLWIRNGINKEAVLYSDDFGNILANDLSTKDKKDKEELSTNQIRNVFGEVRRIQMRMDDWPKIESSVLLLKPKLAYAAKRAKSATALALKEVLSSGLDEVIEAETEDEKKKRFLNFVDFFEAVLAYHKAYGGKD